VSAKFLVVVAFLIERDGRLLGVSEPLRRCLQTLRARRA
jgi:hypothetical protein